MKYLISIILSLCIVTPVYAGMTYENYIALKKIDNDTAGLWMAGAIDGLFWMSVITDVVDGCKTICWPPKLKMSVGIAESFLKNYYEGRPASEQSEDKLALHLILAIRNNFG